MAGRNFNASLSFVDFLNVDNIPQALLMAMDDEATALNEIEKLKEVVKAARAIAAQCLEDITPRQVKEAKAKAEKQAQDEAETAKFVAEREGTNAL